MFSSYPPFEIKQVSPQPIIANSFYSGTIYRPYWKPVRVVFPGGILVDSRYIWLAYGRQDHEIWIAKLDRQNLLESLTSIQGDSL